MLKTLLIFLVVIVGFMIITPLTKTTNNENSENGTESVSVTRIESGWPLTFITMTTCQGECISSSRTSYNTIGLLVNTTLYTLVAVPVLSIVTKNKSHS